MGFWGFGVLGFWVLTLQCEEGVRGGDERCVVVPAGVGASLVVVQAQLALELAIVELDHPAQPGQAREALWFGVGGEVAGPVDSPTVAALRQPDDHPLLAGRLLIAGDWVRGGDSLESEARAHACLALATEGDCLRSEERRVGE